MAAHIFHGNPRSNQLYYFNLPLKKRYFNLPSSVTYSINFHFFFFWFRLDCIITDREDVTNFHVFGKTAENFLGSSTHHFIHNNPSILPPLMIQKLTKTIIFQVCFGAFRSVVSMWNRRDKQAGQRPHHCIYTPLIAPSTVMTVVGSSSGAPPPAMFAPPYTDTAASMAMQPFASSSNAPPPSSPTTPAALGPPRADLCSSKNSHHRSTTTSNPFVHHKQEEGSSLALQQRHMKGIEYTVIYIFLPVVEQYLKIIVHHL